MPFARLTCAADIVFESNTPRCSLLSVHRTVRRVVVVGHRVEVDDYCVTCRSLTGCRSVWPGRMMCVQVYRPARCAESCLRDTLCTLSPSHTLPTAALLGAVLAMEIECYWHWRLPLWTESLLHHPLNLAEMQDRRARACCVACDTRPSLALIRPSCLT